MPLRNITPAHLRCSIGACPAIYEDGPAHLVIVGAVVTDEAGELSGKVGPDERAIRISREMFAELAANRPTANKATSRLPRRPAR